MNVVILNDTRADLHHGCSRVMRILEQGLTARGLTITARSPLRHDWSRDRRILSAMSTARLIVINGEGTLHHGARHGETLLSVVEHPAAARCSVALVNALYQQNPPEWGRMLSRMALIAARDRRSETEIRAAIGPAATLRCVPDLTLAEPIDLDAPGIGVLWGDSVNPEIAAMLASRARERGERLCPSLSVLKRRKGKTALTRALRDLWIARHEAMFRRGNPGLCIAPNEADYARQIAGASLHVTGRFHGVCYSMAARRPFLALASNSWKIAALIEDAGLAPWRLCEPSQIDHVLARGAKALAFSVSETAALSNFLARAQDGAARLFDDLAALARP